MMKTLFLETHTFTLLFTFLTLLFVTSSFSNGLLSLIIIPKSNNNIRSSAGGGKETTTGLASLHRRRTTSLLFSQDLSALPSASNNEDPSEQPPIQQEVSQEEETTPATIILNRGEHYVVVAKPSAVLCHHSDWARSRSDKSCIPMLQRVRDTIGDRVNLIHRLDRGCSGCLLFALEKSENATSTLQSAMSEANKTYIAIVRGEGVLHGRDFNNESWFEVSRPIKDDKGRVKDATTLFRFVAGQHSYGEHNPDLPRASIVLARPKTGRWHQIRRHLNGLGHPILGDTSHGDRKINREWKAKRGMPPERTCLHLAHLQLPPTDFCPDGIDARCPLPQDMMDMLEIHLPGVWKEAQQILKEESIFL